MTVAAAARTLGLSTRAVYALCASHALGHYRLGPAGGKIDISPAQIAAYLASCEVAMCGESKPTAQPARRVSVPDVLGMLRRRA